MTGGILCVVLALHTSRDAHTHANMLHPDAGCTEDSHRMYTMYPGVRFVWTNGWVQSCRIISLGFVQSAKRVVVVRQW